MTLANRTMATAVDVITTINTGRFTNISNSWGGNNSTFTGAPDWGYILFQLGSTYPDFMGTIAWVILFSLPFIMMWLAHADMTPAAAVGFFFGLYAFLFIPTIYQEAAIMFMVIAVAVIVWSIYQKRG